MSTTPYEILSGPFTVWLAPVGETMPDVDTTPAGNWIKLGASGDRNIHEDGVMVSHIQKVNYIRALGSLGPVKALRSEDDLKISFKLMDLTLEFYKYVLNLSSVSTTAAGSGTPGYKTLPLIRAADVNQRAMLIRGASPYGDGWNLDYRIPRVVHSGDPEAMYKKDEPAALLFEFMAIEDSSYAGGRFGEIIAQNATAL